MCVMGETQFFNPVQLKGVQMCRCLEPARSGCICDHAFGSLGFSSISAAVDVSNRASTRGLERLGMRADPGTRAAEVGTSFYVLARETGRNNVRSKMDVRFYGTRGDAQISASSYPADQRRPR